MLYRKLLIPLFLCFITFHFFLVNNFSYNSNIYQKETFFLGTIFFFVELFILFLLIFLELKRYKELKENKFWLYFFIVFLIVFLFLNIELISSKTVIVKDIFGKPLEDIPVYFVDSLGEATCFNPGGGCPNIQRIFPYEKVYLTDGKGEVEIPLKIYFGQKQLKHILAGINLEITFEKKEFLKEDFSSKFLSLKKEKIYNTRLTPFKVLYEECNKILDQGAKNECLLYGILYSAIIERKSELCEKYLSLTFDEESKRSIITSLIFPIEFFRSECLIFVEGFVNGNRNVCEKIENINNEIYSRDMKTRCNCLFNPDKCGEVPKSQFEEIQSLVGDAEKLNLYLCEGKRSLNQEIGYSYSNPSINYLDSVSTFYRKIFC